MSDYISEGRRRTFDFVLPATVELLIRNTEEGRRWRSVAGGPVPYSDGRALFGFAPSWVRHVKLVITETGNGAITVALRRLELIHPSRTVMTAGI